MRVLIVAGLVSAVVHGLTGWWASTAEAPLPEQVRSYGLASSGVGVRLKLLKAFSGEVLGAFPLTDGPATRVHDSRVLFQVNGDF